MENSFFNRVYKAVRNVPSGKVATYGQIAGLCGNVRAARQVGWALHANPEPYVIPCHRVVNKKGELSSAFAFGGVKAQEKLLREEGVEVNAQTVNLSKYQWTPPAQ